MQSNCIISKPAQSRAFEYCLQKIPLAPDSVRKSFENLSPDLYMPSGKGTRTRRLSRAKTPNGEDLIWTHDGKFYQPREYNPVNGGKERQYEPITDDIANSYWMRQFLLNFNDTLELPPNTTFEVHQFRVSCSSEAFGYPAPEGRHRDGRKFVGIAHVYEENIKGALTQLFHSGDEEEPPFLQVSLKPGNLLVFNDEEFFHYTTRFKPAPSTSFGFRDVFILTVPYQE